MTEETTRGVRIVTGTDAGNRQILALANSFHPSMVKRGGGCKDIEVRVLPAPEGPQMTMISPASTSSDSASARSTPAW